MQSLPHDLTWCEAVIEDKILHYASHGPIQDSPEPALIIRAGRSLRRALPSPSLPAISCKMEECDLFSLETGNAPLIDRVDLNGAFVLVFVSGGLQAVIADLELCRLILRVEPGLNQKWDMWIFILGTTEQPLLSAFLIVSFFIY